MQWYCLSLKSHYEPKNSLKSHSYMARFMLRACITYKMRIFGSIGSECGNR